MHANYVRNNVKANCQICHTNSIYKELLVKVYCSVPPPNGVFLLYSIQDYISVEVQNRVLR